MNKLVFVYGSLKKSFHNHRLLANSKFVGEGVTKNNYTMYSFGAFPSVTKEENYPIHGELYEIDDRTLSSLDGLEGYIEGRKNNFYDREVVPIQLNNETVDAFIYFGKTTDTKLSKGVWSRNFS